MLRNSRAYWSTMRKPVGAAGAVDAFCVMVTLRPATVSVAVREEPVGFRATA
jgi:hypothetical protein